MRHDKNLQFCMAQLDSMLNRNEFDPEQRRALEVARKKLKMLWRKRNAGRNEIFRAVRQVAEAILNALKRD